MSILISLVLNALALIITSKIIPGFTIDTLAEALVAALVIGLLNTFIKPILLFLTAPINIVTLGLFTFVINAIILYLASGIVPGFRIDGAVPAIAGAIILSLTSAALSTLFSHVNK